MAECHQQCASDNRRAIAEQAVGKPAAENGSDINQRSVSAEEIDGMAVIKAKLMGKIKDKQGTHAVKAEVFPDLNRHDVINRARL